MTDVRGDPNVSQSVFFAMLLLVVAGSPAFVGVVSQIYVAIELVLGGCYVGVASSLPAEADAPLRAFALSKLLSFTFRCSAAR